MLALRPVARALGPPRPIAFAFSFSHHARSIRTREDPFSRCVMKKFVFGALLATVISGAVLRAVTFGQPDGTRHPHVGAIIFQTPSGYFSCSATLMSPNVLLTAGHCTEEGGVRNLQTWAKFTPAI